MVLMTISAQTNIAGRRLPRRPFSAQRLCRNRHATRAKHARRPILRCLHCLSSHHFRRAAVTHIWEGVMPAVTTKFNADFSIDRAWTAKNIDAQIESGVDGIIVCGSLGEASTLSLDEKLEVLDI